jgi:hypothetical protein
MESLVRVTYVEVWERAVGGELLYHNSWITDLDVTAENGGSGGADRADAVED